MQRFSEDLDFTLLETNSLFTWQPYFQKIEEVFNENGLKILLSEKEKISKTDTRSAFLKENYIETLNLLIPIKNELFKSNPDQILKVKFEIDTNPPMGFKTEIIEMDNLPNIKVRILDMDSLFAGKISAVLGRMWMNRIKGRDLYDFKFYIEQNTNINYDFLRNNLLKQSIILEDEVLTPATLKNLLIEKFKTINFKDAKLDVERFIINTESLDFFTYDDFVKYLNKIN